MSSSVLYLIVLYSVYLVTSGLNGAYGCDNFNFEIGALEDDGRDDSAEVDKNTSDVWPQRRLTRKEENYTFLVVHWDEPKDKSRLCAYNIHYHKQRSAEDKSHHYSVFLQPSATEYKISNLDMGTTYNIYIEAIYDRPVDGKNNVLKSWLLVTKTLGVGPDTPCNCYPQGTVDGKVDACDQLTTQCRCKINTVGLRCDQCEDSSGNSHFYMDKDLGCTACDNCPDNPVRGDGSCVPDGDSMQCNCNPGYAGMHCTECANGYYLQNGLCVACNCSNNQLISAQNFCTAEGVCICNYHTAGNHCEICYPGYVGNAALRTCVLKSHTAYDLGIAALSLIVIVIIVAVLLLIVRRCARQRRHEQFWFGGLKGPTNGSTSGINFTTLVEETDTNPPRKLEIM